jgi:hypothetical protein
LTMATMGLHSAAPVSIPDIRPPRTTPPAAAIVAPMAAPTATQPLAHQRHHPRRGPAHHRAGRHHPHAP